MLLNEDFFVGYSPERINPGDKTHKLKDIIKITSGSNEFAKKQVNEIYNEIIDAGTYSVSSIEIAEAAKVIENIQRDLNIALVNELSIIFKKLGLDTKEVIDAASSKWNFMKFYPGLVGGHCIGVDPYYLIHKSRKIGFEPNIISAGRNINDEMHTIFVKDLLEIMEKKEISIQGADIVIFGYTFKENCPDIRNIV